MRTTSASSVISSDRSNDCLVGRVLRMTSALCEQRARHANDERVLCHFERPEGVEKSADKSVRLTVRATAARGAGAWKYAPLPRGGPDRIVSFRSALDSIAFWNRRPGGLLSGSLSGIIAPSGFVATLYPGRSARKHRPAKTERFFCVDATKRGFKGKNCYRHRKT